MMKPITSQGVNASIGLLTISFGAIWVILSQEAIDGYQKAALISISLAIPLRSFGISVKLAKMHFVQALWHQTFLIMGLFAAISGITFAIASLSDIAAMVFVLSAIATVIASWFVTP